MKLPVFRPSDRLASRLSFLPLVFLATANCGMHEETKASEGEVALRGCETLAADVVSDRTINRLVTPTNGSRTCYRTMVVDLTNARPQALRASFGGAAPQDAATCTNAALIADVYVLQDEQFTLVQQGSTVRGLWIDGACKIPQADFDIGADGDTYRLAVRVSPWLTPASVASVLTSATPVAAPSTTPAPSLPGAGPDGPYPVGFVGSSRRDVQATSERAAPSDEPGFFGTTCDYSHMSKDDPIVFPNQPGRAHLHTFFGNTLTDAYSTADSLLNTGNSTCRGGIANRTAYWVPTLLHRGVPVVPSLSNFYYQGGFGVNNVADVIQHIPDGLRMIAGNGKATGPQNRDNFHWSCLNNYEPVGHQSAVNAADCQDDDYIQMDIVFPQCWNGRELDCPDHMAHMAYPEGGRCPSTHPVVIPAIELHVSYARRGLDLNELRLASDSYASSLPGGYSVHADWFGAWEPAVKDAIVDGCLKTGLDCHSHLLGDGNAIF